MKTKYVNTYEQFIKLTGLLDDEQLTDLKLKPLIGLDSMWYDDDGGIDANYETLNALSKFVDSNKKYHIISRTEGDNNEDCYSNEVRYVNRMKYYLGNKSKESIEYVDLDTIENEENDE